MAYTVRNFKTKKALKEAVAARQAWLKSSRWPDQEVPPAVEAYQPGGMFPLNTGSNVIEGPHGFHRWYASVIIDENHEVVKVKG